MSSLPLTDRMRGETSTEDILVQYLLGQLSEEDRAQIEERFVSDGDYYQQLLLTEDELRCAYAKGSLSLPESKRFEERFLIFADERKRVELAKDFIGELSSRRIEGPAVHTVRQQETAGRWQALVAAFAIKRPAMLFTAAVVVLIAFAWLAYETVQLRKQVSQLEAQRAAREQEIEQGSALDQARVEQLNKELEDKRRQVAQLEEELAVQREHTPLVDVARGAVLSLFLSPSLVRGGGEVKKLTIQRDSSEVRLLLNVGDKTGYKSYRASILDANGRQVWSGAALRVHKVQGAQVVILRIPPRMLAEDDYEINLKGLTNSGEMERVGDYYFTVLKN